MGKVHLAGLPASEYEHPFDQSALATLKKLPGFDKVAEFFLNWAAVKWEYVALQGSNFHVTRESCKSLYDQVKESAAILGVDEFPEIFTKWGYTINGYTTGTRNTTMLVLYSGAIDLLTENQLDFVIGHEMGHIKSGHVLYHTMAQLITSAMSLIPIAGNLITPIRLGLLYWSRMSEFTADRAGLLACQDKKAVLDAIIKMSGAPQKMFGNLDEEVFMRQAEEFENKFAGLADKSIKTLTIATSTHPWTVYRAGELLKWIKSGEYDRLLQKYAAMQCRNSGGWVSKNETVCPYCGLPTSDCCSNS